MLHSWNSRFKQLLLKPESANKNPALSLFKELKRRNVFKIAIAYIVMAWLVIQVADVILSNITAPDWVFHVLLLFLVIGFPFAVIIAWAFERTPEGVRLTQPEDLDRSVPGSRWQTGVVVLVSVVLVATIVVWWFLAGSKSADPGISDRTIAVLPFHTLSSDKANAFTEGIHLDVMTRLSNVSGLHVISRTSVKAAESSEKTLPEIADALGASWVLRAEVQEVGSDVQINARLVNAKNDRQVWAQNYRRTLSANNVFDIQSELSLAIIEALNTHLTPLEKARVDQKPTISLEAYGLHALGRSELDKRDEKGMRAAVRYFEQAIELDPGYVLAWVGLADAHSLLYDYLIDHRESVLLRAGEAVHRALELDPLSAEAHASLGLFEYAQHDVPNSILALTNAVELMPNYADAQSWLAWVQQLVGNSAAGLQSAKRGVAVNPLSGEATSNLTLSFLATGNYEKALSQSRANQAVIPSWPTEKFYEGLALYHMGRYSEVQDLLEDVTVDWTDSGAESLLALSFIASGNETAARDVLARFEKTGDAFSIALVYLALGDTNRAFTYFEQVERWNSWPTLAMRYFFPGMLGPLEMNTRYQEFFEKMNEEWNM